MKLNADYSQVSTDDGRILAVLTTKPGWAGRRAWFPGQDLDVDTEWAVKSAIFGIGEDASAGKLAARIELILSEMKA